VVLMCGFGVFATFPHQPRSHRSPAGGCDDVGNVSHN
jgi:hypothetical protein